VARLEAELRIPEGNENCSSDALLHAKDLQIQKMEAELKELQMQRDAAQARLDEVNKKLQAEEDKKLQAEEDKKLQAEEYKKQADEVAKKHAEELAQKQVP
jgi:membrane protein involved in colicin uptake